MHITRRPSSPSPLWGGIKGGGWPKGPHEDSAISPPTPRLWLHPTRPGCAGPPSPSRGGKTTSNHKTYRRSSNPVYPHPTFSHHRRRRDERPGWKGTGFLGGRLREGQNCAATSLPPLAGVPGKPGGDGPQRFKSTGHAKNPGCMRRCMSHYFSYSDGPCTVSCRSVHQHRGSLGLTGVLGCARYCGQRQFPRHPIVIPAQAGIQCTASAVPRVHFLRAGLPAAGFPPARE